MCSTPCGCILYIRHVSWYFHYCYYFLYYHNYLIIIIYKCLAVLVVAEQRKLELGPRSS